MRFGWVVLLMLSFPVLEAVGIFWVADTIGAWILLWLLLAAIAGVKLISFERLAWGARMAFSLQSGVSPMSALFASGRILLAGGLLVFPGFISDVIALVLLLIPGTWGKRKTDPLRPANDDVPSAAWEDHTNVTPSSPSECKTIDGEFKREPDDLQR